MHIYIYIYIYIYIPVLMRVNPTYYLSRSDYSHVYISRMRLRSLDYIVNHPNTVVQCKSLVRNKSWAVGIGNHFKVVKYFITAILYFNCPRMSNQDGLFRNLCLR